MNIVVKPNQAVRKRVALLFSMGILFTNPCFAQSDVLLTQKQLYRVIALLLVVIGFLIYTIYKRAKENIKQADQLRALDDAKSRFFANISHDLRSPMTLIMGGIQLIYRRL